MNISGLTEKIYTWSQWTLRLFYLNLIWMLFTLAGLVLFGIFPATTALFAVMRRWLIGERDVRMLQAFWTFYKTDFLKSNALGIFLLLIGLILYTDLYFLQRVNGLLQILYVPLLVIGFFYLTILLYIFPMFSHYHLKPVQLIKNSFLISMSNLLLTLGMAGGTAAILYVLGTFPRLLPLLGVSAPAFFLMHTAYRAFCRTEQKKAALHSFGDS